MGTRKLRDELYHDGKAEHLGTDEVVCRAQQFERRSWDKSHTALFQAPLH